MARVFLHLPGWLWALVGLVGWSGWQAGRRTVVIATVAWATPLAAAFASLVVTYPIYSHYEGLVLLAGLLSAMVGASAHRAVCGYSRAAIRTARTATLGFGFVGLLLFIASLDATAAYLPGKATRTDPEPAATSVSTACPRGSTVLVWGWAPELYSYYDWVPASRYVITNVLIRPYAKPDGMERILTSELLESPPDCIVEDVGTRVLRRLRTRIRTRRPDAVHGRRPHVLLHAGRGQRAGRSRGARVEAQPGVRGRRPITLTA